MSRFEIAERVMEAMDRPYRAYPPSIQSSVLRSAIAAALTDDEATPHVAQVDYTERRGAEARKLWLIARENGETWIVEDKLGLPGAPYESATESRLFRPPPGGELRFSVTERPKVEFESPTEEGISYTWRHLGAFEDDLDLLWVRNIFLAWARV